MRKTIGIDLNGWHDFAVRDWSLEDDDKDAPSFDMLTFHRNSKLHTIDGGVCSVVVAFAENSYVGGPQAMLSPIGRGGGWGNVGDVNKRTQIVELWRSLLTDKIDNKFKLQFNAAIAALSVSAESIFIATPNSTNFDNNKQKFLLDCLNDTKTRRAQTQFISHAVAVALSALATDSISNISNGFKIVCVNHTAGGLERSQLILHELPDRHGVYIPESTTWEEFQYESIGLTRLLAEAEEQVKNHNLDLENARREKSRLPPQLMLDGPSRAAFEILRNDNGNWIKMLTAILEKPEGLSGYTKIEPVKADVILLTTPLADPWRPQFVAAIQSAAGHAPLRLMPKDAAAHGALVAGRMQEHNIPISVSS